MILPDFSLRRCPSRAADSQLAQAVRQTVSRPSRADSAVLFCQGVLLSKLASGPSSTTADPALESAFSSKMDRRRGKKPVGREGESWPGGVGAGHRHEA